MIPLPSSFNDCVGSAYDLIVAKRFDDARKLIEELLEHNDEHPGIVYILAYLEHEAKNWGHAIALYKHAINLGFETGDVYRNIAECLNRTWKLEEAIEWNKRALDFFPDNVGTLINMGFSYTWSAQPDKAIEVLEKALELDPGNRSALDNISIAYLSKRNWGQGWDAYESSLGYKYRVKFDYVFKDEEGNEIGKPRWWDGGKVESLAVSSEQGMGDELLFASCLPDAMQRADKVILECNIKLHGLLQRSFPEIDVYGTRYEDNPTWSHPAEAATSLGTLPKFFRRTDDSFPGKPYLKADPVRRAGMRAELDALGDAPKIGIAWTGGVPQTGQHLRDIPLELWGPIFNATDAVFIDLEYKTRNVQGFPVTQFPWATWSFDYDDTAALVAELDMVISTCTSVVHLAGGLGIPCWCMVPSWPNWRFAGMPEKDGHETFIWTDSIKLFRQRRGGEWSAVIRRIAEALKLQFASQSDQDMKAFVPKQSTPSQPRGNGVGDSSVSISQR